MVVAPDRRSDRGLGDELTLEENVHRCTIRLTEVVPHRRIVWLVTSSRIAFVADREEWTGTEVIFDLVPHDGGTELTFTHRGSSRRSPATPRAPGVDRVRRAPPSRMITTGTGDPNLEGRHIEPPPVR